MATAAANSAGVNDQRLRSRNTGPRSSSRLDYHFLVGQTLDAKLRATTNREQYTTGGGGRDVNRLPGAASRLFAQAILALTQGRHHAIIPLRRGVAQLG